MANCETENLREEDGPESGRVRKVSQKWRVHEDGALAYQMQNDEFDYKYGLNRYNRQTSRGDVPVAKLVHSEEEERLQKERLTRLEEQKVVADRDAEMARKVQHEEQLKNSSDEIERRMRMAEAAMSANQRAQDDQAIANQFQQQEMLNRQSERLQLQMSDEEYARYLQEKENKRFERKKKERELARQRKSLQREQDVMANQLLVGYKMEQPAPILGEGFPLQLQAARMGAKDPEKGLLRTDGRVEDHGDFSDFYIQPSRDMDNHEVKELQELQDEELARLLQDQEHKRGAHIDRQKLQQLEEKDAEIARLLHQQDKLRLKKHKQKHQQERKTPTTQDAMTEISSSDQVPSGMMDNQVNSLHERLGNQHIDRNQHSVEQTVVQQRSLERPEGNQRVVERPVGKPAAVGLENPYSTRPLPATPADPQPGSPPPPGYSTTPNRNGSDGNVFSTIDPTMTEQPKSKQEVPEYANCQPRLTEDGYQDLDDLRDATADFAPVQGQRRSKGSRNNSSGSAKGGKDKANCKQQ